MKLRTAHPHGSPVIGRRARPAVRDTKRTHLWGANWLPPCRALKRLRSWRPALLRLPAAAPLLGPDTPGARYASLVSPRWQRCPSG
ncbi:MAG: hypothetical protein ABSC03_00960 [Verrucomicrobiota bacterium]